MTSIESSLSPQKRNGDTQTTENDLCTGDTFMKNEEMKMEDLEFNNVVRLHS